MDAACMRHACGIPGGLHVVFGGVRRSVSAAYPMGGVKGGGGVGGVGDLHRATLASWDSLRCVFVAFPGGLR